MIQPQPDLAAALRLARIRSWGALVFALVGLGLAMWIVVPAPNMTLIPLSVGAPEVSGWLVLHACLALLATLFDLRRQRIARLAMRVALVSLALSLSPLLRFSGAASRAEQSMQAALGANYMQRIPVEALRQMRPSPLALSALFGGFAHDSVRLTTNVLFASPDSVPLHMDIYQPLNAGPHPVLVQIYGGAWQRGVPSAFSEFARYFAARGYVVFAIDYRHAPRFRFPAALVDVNTALAWIDAHGATYDADTSRVALIGRSAGAHLAMLAAYQKNLKKVRAVIDYYGPVDLVEGYRTLPSPDPLDVRAVEDAFLGGPPESAPKLYRDASPISYVTRALPPSLLVYGGRDHIVLPQFGEQLATALRASGSIAVHVEIPWAEHAFDEVPNGPSGQLARFVTERFLAWAMVGRGK